MTRTPPETWRSLTSIAIRTNGMLTSKIVMESDPRSANHSPHILLIGQPAFFKVCDPGVPLEWGKVTFLPFTAGENELDLRKKLVALNPDIVCVFKPECLTTNCLEAIDAVRVGWFTEPVPRSQGVSQPQPDRPRPVWSSNRDSNASDLERRLDNARRVIQQNYDHYITFDPLTSGVLSAFVEIWRAIPLPVSDKLFCSEPETFSANPLNTAFIGRPTPHRDRFLNQILHDFDPLWISHGLHGENLAMVLRQTGVGVNLHNLAYPNFENRVSIHLAAGHLVISEPLVPSHGLEAGHDFVEVTSPSDLVKVLSEVREDPGRFALNAIRGREKAEYFRASAVLRQLVDLLRA